MHWACKVLARTSSPTTRTAKAALDGRFGHAKDHAGLLALRDGHSSRRFDRAHALRPVVAHAGHQHGDAFGAEFVGQRS